MVRSAYSLASCRIRFASCFQAASSQCNLSQCFYSLIHFLIPCDAENRGHISLVLDLRQLIAVLQNIGIFLLQIPDQPYGKLLRVCDLIPDGTDQSKLFPDLLIIKFRPENAGRIQKLHILIQADPLLSLRHAGFVPCFGRSPAREGIDEG